MKIHVIGPVIRETPLLPKEVMNVYNQLRTELSRQGFSVFLPVADGMLEAAKPTEFYSAIKSNILESKIVITVLPKSRDIGPPIESTIASFLNRKLFLLSEVPVNTPRLLLGLPNIMREFSFSEVDKLIFEITSTFG